MGGDIGGNFAADGLFVGGYISGNFAADELFVGGYIGGKIDNPSVTSVTKSVTPSAATATYL